MTKIGLIPMRANPPHLGHAKLMKQAIVENDVAFVFIIQGEITGKDTKRNPLSFEDKEMLINRIEPQIIVDRYSKADIPKIITKILDTGLYAGDETVFHFTIYAGSDRVAQYAAQAKPKYIKQIKDELNRSDYEIGIEIKAIERDGSSKSIEGYSASKVRDAIRNGKDELAMKMMGMIDKKLYKQIKKKVLAGIQKEEIENSINLIMESM